MSNIHKIMQLIRAEAHDRRESAGYDGRHDDGGASELLTQCEYYEYGRAGIIPSAWVKYNKQAEAMADPDYEKYIELKRKFEQ